MVTATPEKPVSREENMEICHHCRVEQSLKRMNLWNAELENLYNRQNCDKS